MTSPDPNKQDGKEESGEQQPPMAQIAPEGLPPGAVLLSFKPENITFRQTLSMFIWHPKLGMAFAAARHFFFRPLLLLLLICGVGGFIDSLMKTPERGSQVRIITEFILNTVGDVSFDGTELHWQDVPEGTLPAGGKVGDLHFRITDKAMTYQPGRSVTTMHGAVLGHDGIRYWRRYSASDLHFQDLKFADMGTMQKLAKMMPEENLLTLSRETLPRVRSQIVLALFLSSWMEFTLGMAMMLASGCLFGGIALALFGRARSLSALFSTFCVVLHFCIIPTVASILYYLSGWANDISSIFSFALLIYLIYTMIEGRSGKLVTK